MSEKLSFLSSSMTCRRSRASAFVGRDQGHAEGKEEAPFPARGGSCSAQYRRSWSRASTCPCLGERARRPGRRRRRHWRGSSRRCGWWTRGRPSRQRGGPRGGGSSLCGRHLPLSKRTRGLPMPREFVRSTRPSRRRGTTTMGTRRTSMRSCGAWSSLVRWGHWLLRSTLDYLCRCRRRRSGGGCEWAAHPTGSSRRRRPSSRGAGLRGEPSRPE